jgi:nucleoside-diphosphate-sugar epimerase
MIGRQALGRQAETAYDLFIMSNMLIFGPGYSAGRLAKRLEARSWDVIGVTRSGRDNTLCFADEAAVLAALRSATHILSSVPPDTDLAPPHDPVLATYQQAIACAPATWIGYLSATGVYGDCKGAWVDESAAIGGGRRVERAAADTAWQSLRSDVRIFRLPGIYGAGRSALDRVQSGRAQRIDMPAQVFSRVHVDDISNAIIASFGAAPGVYNIADDAPASQNDVVAFACALLGLPLPPLISLEAAQLGPMARDFYSENRRIANGRAKHLLGWVPQYPDYHAGLSAIYADAVGGKRS